MAKRLQNAMRHKRAATRSERTQLRKPRWEKRARRKPEAPSADVAIQKKELISESILNALPELVLSRTQVVFGEEEQKESIDLEALLKKLLATLPLMQQQPSQQEQLYEALAFYRSSYSSDYQRYQKPARVADRPAPLPWELKKEHEYAWKRTDSGDIETPSSVGRDMLKKLLKYH